jgi:hypothetical protein
MTDPSHPAETEYFLIPRDDQGDYITQAEQIVRDHDIAEFVQIVRPDTASITEAEQGVIAELQTLLPKRVHLPANSPFLTLQITPPPTPSATEGLTGDCTCQCGNQGSCGGSGGGHTVPSVKSE